MKLRWQNKASIMRFCSVLPAGEGIYRFIQKTFGRLKANPMARIPTQIEIANWILDMGKKIEGTSLFEVGTGHCPIVPIGFFLTGIDQVISVDLHRRLDLVLLEKSMVWMVENRDELIKHYSGLTERNDFDRRMNLMERLMHTPEQALSEANIVYLAPADAANSKLPDNSIDYHISTTVLEHIPRENIEQILQETKRILKHDGVAIHFIDLSDHFWHQDPNINSINFLRFSEKEWTKIAGNQFAYCNRLRASDYLSLFEESGFDIYRNEAQVEEDALKSMKNGFKVNEKFRNYEIDDLCVSRLRVALTVK